MGAKKGKEQGLGEGKEQLGKEVPFQRKGYAYWGEPNSRESAFFPSSRPPKQIPF